MTFSRLSTDEATTLLAGLATEGWHRLGVVLTDGTMLSGKVYWSPSSRSTDSPFPIRDQFNLLFSVGEFERIYVPMEQVAGFYDADFNQASEEEKIRITLGLETERASPLRARERRYESVNSALDVAALECAKERGFQVETYAYAHGITGFRPRRFHRWRGERAFQPLYCDWDYFSHRAGGLRGIGGGFAGVSLSGSAQPSLFRSVYRKLSAKPADLSTVCGSTTGVIEGFVAPASNVQTATGESAELEMEGVPWRAMVVSEGSLSGEKLELSGSWVLAYFRDSPPLPSA